MNTHADKLALAMDAWAHPPGAVRRQRRVAAGRESVSPTLPTATRVPSGPQPGFTADFARTRLYGHGDSGPGLAGSSAAAGRALTLGDHDGPLPDALRTRMQARLRHDFSGVRVHTGPDADQAARAVKAVAFTMGDDVVLGDDADRPGSLGGDRLLAHELTHVVQQREAASVVDGVSAPDDAAEREAHAVAAGGSMTKAARAVNAVQRQVTTGKEKATVTRADAQAALTDYLKNVLQEQGRQTLQITEQLKQAVLSLFSGNQAGLTQVQVWLAGVGLPGDPAGFAAQVVRFLPDVVPAESLAALRRVPVKQAPDRRPKTTGEAIGAAVADSPVTSLVRALKLPKDRQDKIIDGARSAVAAGVVAIVDQVLGSLRVGSQAQNAIHSAVEGLIKQQPGKAGDRQQEGAGSPYYNPPPPSVTPAPPSAPGQHIFTLPPIKWDFPGTQPLPKPSRPPATPDPRATAVAGSVDPNALIPADVRGTARAGEYADAANFARDVAQKLEQAQKARHYSVFLELGANYANVKDRGEIYDAARRIILQVRDALPHKASEVVEVWLTINGRQVFRVPLHPGAD